MDRAPPGDLLPMQQPADDALLLKQRTRQTRWLALALVPALVVSAPLFTTWWLREILEALGVMCLAACVAGRAWTAVYIVGRKGRELVTLGPYSAVRNPLYVASFIGLIGCTLISGMVTLLAIAVLVFVFYYRTTVSREEVYLHRRHGAAYEAYVRAVPRWWPNLSAWREAPAVTTDPHVVLTNLRDSSVFFLVFAAFEAVHVLQQAGIVPVLIRLP